MRHAWALGLAVFPLGALAAGGWNAPYPLEGQEGRTFRVVLGEKAPKDARARLGVMTLLGKKGLATARLQRLESVCAELCASERPTCHAVGLYAQEPGTGDVGEGLAALPGRITGRLSAPAPVELEPAPTAKQWASTAFQTPVDERLPAASERLPPLAFRWTPRAEGVAVLQERQLGADFYAPPIQLAECRQERQALFTRLVCPAASVLYAKGQLLFASFDDYGPPATEWLVTLQADGQQLYLVRLGLKAHAVPGLLFHDGARWRLLIRPADYPLMC